MNSEQIVALKQRGVGVSTWSVHVQADLIKDEEIIGSSNFNLVLTYYNREGQNLKVLIFSFINLYFYCLSLSLPPLFLFYLSLSLSVRAKEARVVVHFEHAYWVKCTTLLCSSLMQCSSGDETSR